MSMLLDNLKDNYYVHLLYTGRQIGIQLHISTSKTFQTTYSAFNKLLTNITEPNVFTCKSTPSHHIVEPAGHRNFNKIINHLHETNVSFNRFHSYTPHHLHKYRVVILTYIFLT